MIFTSQPRPNGSSLTGARSPRRFVAGSSMSDSFRSTTTPTTGEIKIRRGLHRLDYPERLAGNDFSSDLRQFQEGRFGELFDGELGDADGDDVAVELGPLVRRRVTQLVGFMVIPSPE